MAKKKNRTIRWGRCKVSIKRNPAYGEVVVSTYVGTRRVGEAFESDMQSARGTAAASLRWLRKRHRAACTR